MSYWHSLIEFLSTIEWSFWGVWSLTLVLLISGLLGTFVPLLPGPLLIFAACVEHTVLRPQSGMSWSGLGVEFLLVVIVYALELMSGAAGTKWFGGSRWGIAGVLIGGIIGLFFGFFGILIGPFIGGFLFELLFAKMTVKPAAKATWGTLVGTGLGMVARVVIGVLMVVIFFVDALWL